MALLKSSGQLLVVSKTVSSFKFPVSSERQTRSWRTPGLRSSVNRMVSEEGRSKGFRGGACYEGNQTFPFWERSGRLAVVREPTIANAKGRRPWCAGRPVFVARSNCYRLVTIGQPRRGRFCHTAAMATKTIPEYLEDERRSSEDTQLRTDEEANRIELRHPGHHRTRKQPELELAAPVQGAVKATKAAVVKARKPVAVKARKPPAAKAIKPAVVKVRKPPTAKVRKPAAAKAKKRVAAKTTRPAGTARRKPPAARKTGKKARSGQR